MDQIYIEREGILQLGSNSYDIHFKFAMEIVPAIMLRGILPSGQEAKTQKIINVLGKSCERLLSTLDEVLLSYAERRGLLS